MSTDTPLTSDPEIDYPDSDGQPMAENTLQFRWIVTLQGNLDLRYAADPNVFVAGDLLWYPVEGDNALRMAPDVLVAIGRPKGRRGSYMQWREDGVAPQVVWEVLSPGNRAADLQEKFEFYQTYGVEEYYQYDPDRLRLRGWQRAGDQLVEIPGISAGWTSPRLGVRMELSEDELQVWYPDGRRFLTFLELGEEYEAALRLAQAEREMREAALSVAQAERAMREVEQTRREAAETNLVDEQRQRRAAEERAEKLLRQLRALGLEPDEAAE